MAKYKVIPRPDQTFHVAMVGNDGVRRTLLGFRSHADAQDWIMRDRWERPIEEPWTRRRTASPSDL